MSSKTTRLENLLEAVPDALVGMDQEGVIRFVNHQTESLFGYDRDHLVGQPIQTLVPEYLWEVYSEHREEYFADPRSRSMGLDLELIGRQGDGTQFPVNITLSHIDTGDVLLRISAALEVTKRKQALENAQRMTAIVENSNDAIIGMTLNGMVTSWNAAAEKLYGHSSEEIIGKSIALLSPEDRTGEIISALAKIKAGQPVERLETIRIRKDGTAFPVSVSVSPIPQEDGAVVGAASIPREVIEPRQAFEVAQRIAAIVEGSDDAIYGGTLDGIVTSWNPAAERMYGYPSQEIIGKSFDLLVPEDRMNEIRAILARIIAGKTVERLETIRARKNGMTFPVSLTISAIRDANFAIIGASMIGRDMTEQKEASEASEASRTRRPSSSSAGKPSSAPHTTASSRTGTPRPRGSMATTKKSSASPTG